MPAALHLVGCPCRCATVKIANTTQSVLVSLPSEITDLAERLITNKRNDRNQRIEAGLWTRQDDSAARNALGTGFYVAAQKEACIRELKERTDEIWSSYKRVIGEASIPWSEAIRESLVARIAHELEEDTARMVRSVHQLLSKPRRGGCSNRILFE